MSIIIPKYLNSHPLITGNDFKNWEQIYLKKNANNLVIKSYEFAIEENLNWPPLIKNKLAEIDMMQSFEGDDNTDKKSSQE